MFYCHTCGAELPDGANFCPSCGAVQNANNVYGKIPNTPHDTAFSGYQPTGPKTPYASPEEQSFVYQQRHLEAMKDASNAKVFGIISIICAVISSFVILGWIFGAVGLAKANSAAAFAQQTNNFSLLAEANSAKTLNKAGLIISGVITFFGFIALFFVWIGLIAVA